MPSIRNLLFLGVALLVAFATPSHAQTTHLKCYKASDPLAIRGPGPAWLHLNAGMMGDDFCRIVGGFRLVCVPTESEVTAPLEGRNSFGPFTPLTLLTLPNPETLNQDRLCYKISCVSHPNIDANTAFTDTYGERKLTRYKPYLVCGPAEASLCGDGNLDFGEDCDDGNRINGDCCNASCHAEPITQSCGPDTDGNECTTPMCDGFGFCDQQGLLEPTTTACTDTDGESCTAARCDGNGNCDQNGLLQPSTTPCADTDNESCTQARCNGLGSCDQLGFLEPTTTTCADTDGNECTGARCNGAGACSQTGFLAPTSTSCADTDGNECTSARCNGAGACSQSGFLAPVTTPCGDIDGNECTSARCNGAGACSQTGVVSADHTACSDTDGNVCTVAQCIGGSCNQSVAVPLGTACPNVDLNECNQPGCDENGVCAQNFYVRNCSLGEICQPATGICQ
jgi:hypothetical protein